MILIIAKWLLVYVLEHKHNFHAIIIFHLECAVMILISWFMIHEVKTSRLESPNSPNQKLAYVKCKAAGWFYGKRRSIAGEQNRSHPT